MKLDLKLAFHWSGEQRNRESIYMSLDSYINNNTYRENCWNKLYLESLITLSINGLEI
jgi:hypothetical protein